VCVEQNYHVFQVAYPERLALEGNRNLTHDDTALNSARKWFLPFSVCDDWYRPYTLL